MRTAFRLALLLTVFSFALPLGAQTGLRPPAASPYDKVVRKVEGMLRDSALLAMAQKHGLNVLSVTWEDTARTKGSCVGPNISDMTIQVHHGKEEQPQSTCMPVIRHPNFADVTADLPIGKFLIRVGNEKGKELKTIPLGALLEDPRAYLTDPTSWAGSGTTLLAETDSHFLVSAQACFLPIPQSGDATFNPAIFNYQSSGGQPAVLTILVTREGTSMTIIDNTRDALMSPRGYGQRLFFNSNGQKAPLTGKRLSEFTEEPVKTTDDHFGTEAKANLAKGLNMVMLVQVPLKHTSPVSKNVPEDVNTAMSMDSEGSGAPPQASNVEEAVIGHGALEGPFTEFDNQPIERDPRFPIRVTVQFYKATDNGVVSEEDMLMIKDQLDLVYKDATYIGSLVVPASNDPVRPTDWQPTRPRL